MILKLIGQSNLFHFQAFTLVILIGLVGQPVESIADTASPSTPATTSNGDAKKSLFKSSSNRLGFGKSRPKLLQRLRERLSGLPNGNASQPNEDEAWKTLKDKWVVSQFGGDGPVVIKDKLITMGFGDPLTGIRWEAELPKENYEVELEARRREGFDFFCALTFPVGDKHVSFILGGWGGGVVGISSVDGFDASENETTSFRNFETDRWYKIRARVDANQIQCWIDNKPAAEQTRKGHEFDIRYEMDQCVPLGVAAFQCKSEVRNIRIRKLTMTEIKAAEKEAAKPTE